MEKYESNTQALMRLRQTACLYAIEQSGMPSVHAINSKANMLLLELNNHIRLKETQETIRCFWRHRPKPLATVRKQNAEPASVRLYGITDEWHRNGLSLELNENQALSLWNDRSDIQTLLPKHFFLGVLRYGLYRQLQTYVHAEQDPSFVTYMMQHVTMLGPVPAILYPLMRRDTPENQIGAWLTDYLKTGSRMSDTDLMTNYYANRYMHLDFIQIPENDHTGYIRDTFAKTFPFLNDNEQMEDTNHAR